MQVRGNTRGGLLFRVVVANGTFNWQYPSAHCALQDPFAKDQSMARKNPGKEKEDAPVGEGGDWGRGDVVACLEFHVDTFGGNVKLATLDDLDRLNGLVTAGRLEVLDLVNDVVALEDLAKDNVTAVEPPVEC